MPSLNKIKDTFSILDFPSRSHSYGLGQINDMIPDANLTIDALNRTYLLRTLHEYRMIETHFDNPEPLKHLVYHVLEEVERVKRETGYSGLVAIKDLWLWIAKSWQNTGGYYLENYRFLRKADYNSLFYAAAM